MEGNVKIVPASCTQCGGTVEVDPGSDKAVCPFCGTSFIIEKAIQNYNIQHMTIEHADNVNIDMTGSVKTVLDFVGNQMKESRAEKRELRKQEAEKDRRMFGLFSKMMIIMFAGMFVLAIVAFIFYQITGGGESEDSYFSEFIYSQDTVVSGYYTKTGLLSVDIYDPGEYTWHYYNEGSTEKLDSEEADFDGYHFIIEAAHEDGIGYAIVAEYDDDSEYPNSYGIAKFVITGHRVTDIVEVSHVSDLSQYSFEED